MQLKRALALLMIAACGDDAPEPAAYEICDGSSDVRFGYASSGGFVESTYAFTNPYGHEFLFVNGRCELAAGLRNQELRIGTLPREVASDLARAFDLARIQGKTYRAGPGCADAGPFQVMTANGYLELLCGDDAPSYATLAADALERAQQAVQTYGAPVTGDASVLAIGNYETRDAPNPDATAWPFSWPIGELAVEWNTNGGTELTSRRLTGADATLARQLRQQAAATPRYRGHVDILAGERGYTLFVRDELDASWVDGIARFRNEVDPYAARPVANCGADTIMPALDAPYLQDLVLGVTAREPLPCGARLCWSEGFREEHPVGVTLRVEVAPARTCEGAPNSYLRTHLQPLVDAYRTGYPSSAVAIDVSVFGATPHERLLIED